MIPNHLNKQFEGIINRKNELVKESKEEKIERLKNKFGLSHGKGKRKRRNK